MSGTLKYSIVDAFAQGPYSANPAGVVLNADELNEAQMRHIAREINLAETAFVSRIGDAHRTMRIRWFTPLREVDFCGHATLASAQMLLKEGIAAAPKSAFVPQGARGSATPPAADATKDAVAIEFEARSGMLRLRFEPLKPSEAVAPDGFAEPEGIWWLTAPDAGLKPDNTNPMHTAQLLGITMDDLNPRIPIMRTRDDDLILSVSRWDTLVQMRPKFDELGRWGEQHNLRGFFVTTTQTLDPNVHVQSRFFAPSFGVNEDPVTGSAHGALGALLARYKLLPEENGVIAANCIQGEPGGRTGLVRILAETVDHSTTVQVGGRCSTIMRGELRVPSPE